MSFAKGKHVLILGGARSGKSRFALELAKSMGKKVLFVATAQPLDEEMGTRIEEHKKARPPHWKTLEITSNVGGGIRENIGDAGVVILDCLTLLISNLITGQEVLNFVDLKHKVGAEVNGLINCMEESKADFIVVSNEVGMGLVPDCQLGRFYRDLLGGANQLLAQYADEVYFMMAGIPLKIKGHPLCKGNFII